MGALLDATAQAFEAASDMQTALLAAAKLLRDCTCQRNRAVESLAACHLADSAISKWQGATRVIANIAKQSYERFLESKAVNTPEQ